MLLAATPGLSGPSANRTRDGSGLLNTLIFGDSEHQKPTVKQPDSRVATTGAKNDQPERKQNPKQVGEAFSGTMRPAPDGSKYDGVWRDSHGRTLLIKQVHRTIYLSGSNHAAAWQAQCVSDEQSARCIGNGISKTAGEFRYESNLNPGNHTLVSDWTRHYAAGQTSSAQTTFRRLR